jgi:hypothetical protein
MRPEQAEPNREVCFETQEEFLGINPNCRGALPGHRRPHHRNPALIVVRPNEPDHKPITERPGDQKQSCTPVQIDRITSLS